MEAPISGNAHEAGRRLVVILVLSFLFVFALALPSSAAPADVARAKREVAALREQVEHLNKELALANEELEFAQVQLSALQEDLKKNERVLSQAEKDLLQASERLDKRVRGIYKDGSASFWEALLTASSLSEFMNRLEFLSRVGEQDGQVFTQVASFREKVSQKKDLLAAQKTKQNELLAQAAAAEESVEKSLASRQKALQGKEAQVAELEREEEARQARLLAEAKEAARQAKEAARQANEAEKARAAATPKASTGSQGAKPSPSSSPKPAQSVPPSPKGSSAVEIALSMVGVPYRWGGNSPSGFDCSGLVQYAFGQVGVSLPHSSRALFSYGRAVSRSDLQPGDLVFFGSPIHHMGIYVGNGSMVHAPYTGANVRVSSMGRSDYAGARRIM